MRVVFVAMVAVSVAGACSPEIGPGAYFCGPERLCPPGLACDDDSYTCELPAISDRFTCPLNSQAYEPDDSIASARDDLAVLGCGDIILQSSVGCIVDGDDIDFVRFRYDGENCVGSDPRFKIDLRFPVAFVPLDLALLDDAGEIVAEGVLCTSPSSVTGQDELCLEAPLVAGEYYVQVSASPGGGDCDGDCAYNRYDLDIALPIN